MLHIFHMPTIKQEASRTAHGLAMLAYRWYTGKSAPDIVKDVNGKPFFVSGGLYLSISHTDGAALCAISDAPVGLDAEQPRSVASGLMERCLAPEELAACRRDAQPEALFLRFWTLKEAYAKYTGRGIVGFPNAWSFQLNGACAVLAGESLWFQTIQAGNLTISVCSQTRQNVQLHWDFAENRA